MLLAFALYRLLSRLLIGLAQMPCHRKNPTYYARNSPQMLGAEAVGDWASRDIAHCRASPSARSTPPMPLVNQFEYPTRHDLGGIPNAI
jgi:hypothetical protein